MAGSMGPIGIAFGVAISEGVAKAIGEATPRPNVDIPRVLRNSITHVETQELTVFALTGYGFVNLKMGLLG